MPLLRAQLGAVLHGAVESLHKGGLTGLFVSISIGIILCFLRLGPRTQQPK